MKIRKAVVPAAGYGTRFLPATKSIPKEMLPIVDKPTIQYVIEELVQAGIEQIILVTGWHKRAIEDHFDRHLELEQKLEETGKTEYLEAIRKVSDMAEFVYVRQKQMRGNGDAILTAKNIVGNEPFVVHWADEFIVGEPNATKQMIEAYNKFGTSILGGVRTDKPEDSKKYGFVAGPKVDDITTKVEELIEKPGEENKPSNLAIVSQYVFVPEIFEAFENFPVAEGKELVWVDGINSLREKGIDSHAVEIQHGTYYDCGNVAQYLKTNVALALERPEIREQLAPFIKETASKL